MYTHHEIAEKLKEMEFGQPLYFHSLLVDLILAGMNRRWSIYEDGHQVAILPLGQAIEYISNAKKQAYDLGDITDLGSF